MIAQEQIDEINDDLDDTFGEAQYDSAQEAFDAVKLALEAYGISVPETDDFEDEIVFKMDFEDSVTCAYLYICVDSEDGKYEVYASILDESELNVLDSLLDGPPEVPDVDSHVIRNRKTQDV